MLIPSCNALALGEMPMMYVSVTEYFTEFSVELPIVIFEYLLDD
jgi:hypothetical protein